MNAGVMKKSSNKYINLLKRIGGSLAIPVIVYLFFLILTRALGIVGFGGLSDLQNILFTTAYCGLFSLAMAINLTSGRFDYSMGATMVLALIAGGNLNRSINGGPITLLFFVAVIGCLTGMVTGLVYVTLSLPAMVTALGLAMIYEAVGFIINNGKGLNLVGKSSVLVFANFPINIIIIVVAAILMTMILNYSQFGFDRQALCTGQKISVDVGISERKNAVKCYAIAGILLGIAGCVYISKYGTIAPETGLSSSSYVIMAFLPVFISTAIEKYCPMPIGVILGAFTQACITSGFSRLGFSSSMQSVLNGVLIMIILVYTYNRDIIEIAKEYKEKRRKALARKQELLQ